MAAKLNVVASARQDQGNCQKCGNPIEKGTSYVWFKNRLSPRLKFHNTPECRPSAADRESNPKRAAWIQASEDLQTAKSYPEDPSTAAEHLRSAMANVEDVIEQIEESLSNWSGTNFETGEMAMSFESSRDYLQDWLNDAESAASELEGMETPDEPDVEPEDPEPTDYEGGENDPDYLTARDEYASWQTANEEYEAALESIQATLDEIDDIPDLEF